MKSGRDSDHYRMQYNLPNTWSQKYNLVYQKILSLNLFPADVAKLESDFYQTKMLDYGIALNSRLNLAKVDWTAWVSAFNDDKQQEDAIFAKIYKFANETPERMPFGDLYSAASGRGYLFRARPVMGALFIRALLEHPNVEALFKKSNILLKRHRGENKSST